MLPYPKINRLALLFGREDLRVQETDLRLLNPGEILVKIAAATTCGTDRKTFLRGGHPKIMQNLPSPMGHEMAGVVAAVTDTTAVKPGDRVVLANSAPCQSCFYCERGLFNLCENLEFLNGGFSQYIIVPKNFIATGVHVLPSGLDLRAAALTEPLACVLHACEVVGIGLNDVVVIVGTGPMAALFVQVIKAKGAKSIVIGRRKEPVDMMRGLGADHIVNAEQTDAVVGVKELTRGLGADVAVEAIGKPETWQLCLSLVRRGGRVCAYGGCAAGTTVSIDTYRIHYDEISFFGVFHHTPAVFKRAIELLNAGKINTQPFLSCEKKLDDLPQIFSGQDEGHQLKYVICP